MTSSLDALFSSLDRDIWRILDASLEGHELSVPDALRLSTVTGRELSALCLVADELRRAQAGDTVTYVVNRNINFTNVCNKACRFCAFARGHRSEQSYFLSEEEIVRRALEARSLGATEVCIQAGLAPGMSGRYYIDLCKTIKAAAPELDLHAFSPEEVKYACQLSGMPARAYLQELKAAGLGSLPGTSAEILDDTVRAKIAPGRITTAEWIEIITTAHEVGLPTTATIMFGHVETDAERIAHLDLLRSIQKDTRGFTEIVPLSFVHDEAPMWQKGMIPGLRPGPTGNEVLRLFALCRLMLGATFKNVQVSWVKEGLRMAGMLLAAGANDLGGTLINESISTSAGASHGQFQSPSSLRRAIRDAGRVPAQRNTRYAILRSFAGEPEVEDEALDQLDQVEDADARFGTYASMTRDEAFRFVKLRRARPIDADKL
ncbi:MAG: 5-amino-6-(D-ribitylamino)uracil--L-tyrosine 4-hydroxyphenyl transferase CofH [Byssovorax sp.]